MAKRTPLYDNHVAHGGKIVEFGGFELPIQYPEGLITEHMAVRQKCGLFDVSHMGEFEIKGQGATEAIQMLITNDISDMQDGQVRYTMMLNEKGGQVDDLLVYRFNENHYYLVVNAGNCEKDAKWVEEHLLPNATFKNLSDTVGQVALQGPLAEKIMLKLVPQDALPSKYYTFVQNNALMGINCIISRTGYTGEDGFEIYSPAEKIGEIFEKLLEVGKEDGLIACGLGARDTLRFEACMPLYGHELGEDFLATEVGLNIFIKMDKSNFIGKQALIDNPAMFKRKGVEIVDKGIAREGCDVYDANGNLIGKVTTGTMSPYFKKAIAMVRIPKSNNDEELFIDVRGKKLKAKIVKMPFYKRESK
ncbi:MAG: glycine cleavage system aminomethyltransferase GcvT [Clostridia bacterium]|nr:glycine cleavage system aminomethyltransferase GcvT [Clostridia bacterium]